MQSEKRAGGGGRQSVHQYSFLVGGEFSVRAKRWLRASPHAVRIAAACGVRARRREYETVRLDRKSVCGQFWGFLLFIWHHASRGRSNDHWNSELKTNYLPACRAGAT
jgi:hypothetical protein